MICQGTGCQSEAVARSLCHKHYKRWERHGDPNVRLVARKTAHERFQAKVSPAGDGCWLWTGARFFNGYGQFRGGGGGSARVRAHRWSYEYHVGPIPEGLQLDHLCRIRHCVNPAHLEPVTQAENNRRKPSLLPQQA